MRVAPRVAGVVEGLFVAGIGAAPWTYVIGGDVIPALIGNTLGGVSLVAVLNHAQVSS